MPEPVNFLAWHPCPYCHHPHYGNIGQTCPLCIALMTGERNALDFIANAMRIHHYSPHVAAIEAQKKGIIPS